MDTLRNLAVIGLIDTPQMRAAIKTVDGISDLHKWALCSCMSGIQQKLIDGLDIETIMSMGYQDLVANFEPTEDSLTDVQRMAVLEKMKTCILATLDAVKLELEARDAVRTA